MWVYSFAWLMFIRVVVIIVGLVGFGGSRFSYIVLFLVRFRWSKFLSMVRVWYSLEGSL